MHAVQMTSAAGAVIVIIIAVYDIVGIGSSVVAVVAAVADGVVVCRDVKRTCVNAVHAANTGCVGGIKTHHTHRDTAAVCARTNAVALLH